MASLASVQTDTPVPILTHRVTTQNSAQSMALGTKFLSELDKVKRL